MKHNFVSKTRMEGLEIVRTIATLAEDLNTTLSNFISKIFNILWPLRAPDTQGDTHTHAVIIHALKMKRYL